MDVKTAIATHEESAILVECERGEDSAKKNYTAAIEKPLPNNILDLVNTQFRSISETHDRIKSLRDEANNDVDKAAAAAK